MEKITLTVHEMAEALGISLPTAYRLAHKAGFPTLPVGRKLLIPKDGLEKWVHDQMEQGGKAWWN